MWKGLTTSGREERMLELLLRIGVAGCYIGHGAFGVITKEAWLPYFAAVGIGPDWAWTLMPVVGSLDILIGILALVAPRPVILGYAAVWGVWTALLRPLAGESVFETLERAGNYGVPIALLLLAATTVRPTRAWLSMIEIPPLTPQRRRRVMLTLRATTATLLAGHGGLALLGKPLLAGHLAAIGLPAGSLAIVGAFEVALAAAVAVGPSAGLLMTILIWKIGTEALYPLTGAPFWEFVERAGSYIAPLALWTMIRAPAPTKAPARARSAAASLIIGLGVFTATGAIVSSAGPVDGQARPLSPAAADTSLLGRLQAGGLVLACRHAATDRSRGDRRSVDFDDPETQRVLSEHGRRQARRLGEALRRQRIPVGRVLASPYDRATMTAELAFGRSTREDGLYRRIGSDVDRERVHPLFAVEPAPGRNRVLVSHQWVLYPAMPTVERGSIAEGECVVLDPDGESFEVLATLGPEDFEALGEGESPRPGSDRGSRTRNPALTAALAGGTSIVCRHARTGSFREREPVDYADSTTQRLLSPAGERQSREMGAAMVESGVEVTELISSPMSRARRTAYLMFGRDPRIDPAWHTNGGTYGGEAREARRRVLRRTPERGNRVIVSHIGTMRSVLDDPGDVGEGDCVIVRAGGGEHGYRVLGVVGWEEWGA